MDNWPLWKMKEIRKPNDHYADNFHEITGTVRFDLQIDFIHLTLFIWGNWKLNMWFLQVCHTRSWCTSNQSCGFTFQTFCRTAWLWHAACFFCYLVILSPPHHLSVWASHIPLHYRDAFALIILCTLCMSCIVPVNTQQIELKWLQQAKFDFNYIKKETWCWMWLPRQHQCKLTVGVFYKPLPHRYN